MAGLMDVISQAIGGDTVRQMSRQLGANEHSTGTAISAALTLLLSALARNSGQPQGAGALGRTQRQQGLDAGALGSLLQSERQGLQQATSGSMDMVIRLLDKDGDGSVLDDRGGMLGKLTGGR